MIDTVIATTVVFATEMNEGCREQKYNVTRTDILRIPSQSPTSLFLHIAMREHRYPYSHLDEASVMVTQPIQQCLSYSHMLDLLLSLRLPIAPVFVIASDCPLKSFLCLAYIIYKNCTALRIRYTLTFVLYCVYFRRATEGN